MPTLVKQEKKVLVTEYQHIDNGGITFTLYEHSDYYFSDDTVKNYSLEISTEYFGYPAVTAVLNGVTQEILNTLKTFTNKLPVLNNVYKTYNLRHFNPSQLLATGALIQFLKINHYFSYDFKNYSDEIIAYFDDEIVTVCRELSTALNEDCVGEEYLASYEKVDNCLLVFSCDNNGELHILYRVNL